MRRACILALPKSESGRRRNLRRPPRMLTKSTDWQSDEKACKPRKLRLHPRELT